MVMRCLVGVRVNAFSWDQNHPLKRGWGGPKANRNRRKWSNMDAGWSFLLLGFRFTPTVARCLVGVRVNAFSWDQNQHPKKGMRRPQSKHKSSKMVKHGRRVVVPATGFQVYTHSCARVGLGSVLRDLGDEKPPP